MLYAFNCTTRSAHISILIGCRHCPFNHINVKDKSRRIQQPAFLYEGAEKHENAYFTPVSKVSPNSEVKVLFFSGGKDSFLAIRRLVKQHQSAMKEGQKPFHLILLTTFDVESRVIAHQEVSIDTVLRQAKHLEIPLLAIPLCRTSGEPYLSRIEKGLDVIRSRITNIQQMTLAFGDLHLNHIRDWRENELSKYQLEYPLWRVPYEELMTDLEASRVPVVVSASTKDGIEEGMQFNRDLMKKANALGFDGFGESGEFHSVAKVWTVSKDVALGMLYDDNH